MNNLSIVCFVTNLKKRGVHRCKNFLHSLRNQKDTHVEPEIIIVNCSNDNSFDEIDFYCKEYKVKHIFSKLNNPVWNKSLAMNFGIRCARHDFIMGTDIDYIFQDNFLQIVQERANYNKILLCHVFMSKKKHFGQFINYLEKEYQNIKEESKFFGRDIADGACQLSTKKWFEKVRGYNESILMWGGMDNELHRVAIISGLEEDWIDDKTSILHQFHLDAKAHKIKDKEYITYGKKYRVTNIRIVNKQNASKNILPRNIKSWGNLKVNIMNDYTGL